MQFTAFAEYASATGRAVAVIPEPQSSDYESGIADINGEPWHIRTARITPTKPGAFVAFWRRTADGNTAPFATDDPAAGLLVFVQDGDNRGVFTFASAHLAELGLTAGVRPGKRGFRVYPPWCTGLNPAATATQRAHASAFSTY